MEPTVKAAAIYTRISQDRNGTGLGIERQERLCRDLAARKGWTVAQVYSDNDRSAYTGKPRPGYEAMCADLAAARRDAVLVVDTDRLTRHPRELEDFITLADRHSVALANVSGDMDLSTSDGRFRARILGAVARQESEKKSERIRRQREQAALAGKPHPGPRPFGYEPGGMEIRESEAALLRDAAAAVLAGRSVRSIADEWNDAGITTARGNTWSVGAITDMLVRLRNIARRRHQGEELGEASWPPIFDDDTHERLVVLVTRRKQPMGRPPRRLLTGIATCSYCDTGMVTGNSHGTRVYACRRRPGDADGSCGRLSIVADPLDELITDAVLARLADSDLRKRVTEKRGDRRQRDLAAALRADEEGLEQLTIEYSVERIHTKAGYLKAKAQLEERITHLRDQLDAEATSDVLATMPGPDGDLHAWWDAFGVTERRQVIERLLVKVVITPRLPRKRRQFDTERVTPLWRI